MPGLKPDPALAESFREFYTQILHFLRKRTDNASDAADMTQDVFTQWLGYQDRAKVEQPRAFCSRWRAICCAITGVVSRCATRLTPSRLSTTPSL